MRNPQAVLFTEEERPNLPPLSSKVILYKLDVDVLDASPLVRPETCKIYNLMGRFIDKGIKSPAHLFRELYEELRSLPGTWFSTARISLSLYAKEFLDYRPLQDLLKRIGLYKPIDEIPESDRPAYILYLSIDTPHSIHRRFADYFMPTLHSLAHLIRQGYGPVITSDRQLAELRETFNLLLKCEALGKICSAKRANLPALAIVKEHHRHNFGEELEFLDIPVLKHAREVKEHFSAFIETTSIKERIVNSSGVRHISEVLRIVISDLAVVFKEPQTPASEDPYQEMFDDY